MLDLRDLNECMYAAALILPDIEPQTTGIPASAKYFSVFDALNGFDLLRLQDILIKVAAYYVPVWGVLWKSANLGYHGQRVFSNYICSEEIEVHHSEQCAHNSLQDRP